MERALLLFLNTHYASCRLVTAGTASAPRQHASQSAAHVRYLYCPPVGPPAHMLNEWCLLGRKPDWEPGRYSTLAGFIEVGGYKTAANNLLWWMCVDVAHLLAAAFP